MPRLTKILLCLALIALLAVPAYAKKSKKSTSTDEEPLSVDEDSLKAAAKTDEIKLLEAKKGPATAFVASLSTIIVSELGDKTFFIAAIMAMRYNQFAVLGGALLALFLMTAISTGFGTVITTLVPQLYVHIICTGLFLFFGVKLLYDALSEKEEEGPDEKSEVEQELNELHSKMTEKKTVEAATTEEDALVGEKATSPTKRNGGNVDIESSGKAVRTFETVSTKLVFWQALTLTFLGEWGDRSQISTIALAANSNAFMVFLGGFLGHVCCTSLAVWGGKYFADKISEKHVNIAGGILFLLFGAHNVYTGVPK